MVIIKNFTRDLHAVIIKRNIEVYSKSQGKAKEKKRNPKKC